MVVFYLRAIELNLSFFYSSDRNWRMIPQYLRNQLGLTFEDDGEFYMSFRDFLKYFGELEICHLSPDSVNVGDNKKKFEVFHFNGSWRAGSTSGGCGNAGNCKNILNSYFSISFHSYFDE